MTAVEVCPACGGKVRFGRCRECDWRDDWDWDDEEDQDDDEYGGPVSCMDPATHRPRVLAAQCSTCILRPGNLMHLAPGRLAGLMRDATREGSQGMICHDTLPGVAPEGVTPALCRGFYDRYGPRNNFVRVMDRLGGFQQVEPPQADDRPPGEPDATTHPDIHGLDG